MTEKIDLSHWWKASFAGGIALAVAAAAIGHNALILIGIGFACFGIGEWINRPIQQALHQGYGVQGIITAHPWRPKPVGLALDAIGVALFLIGAYRLVFI